MGNMDHGGQSYLGLRGTKLNIAVGVIAGLDFLCVPTLLPSILPASLFER